MPVQEIYKLDKIVFPSSAELHTLGNVSTKFGVKSQMGRAVGQIYPNFVSTERQQPQIDFTTKALDAALALAGVGGAAITSAVSCYLKQAATAGYTARATTQHKKGIINNSCLYWSSLRLPHSGQGELSMTLMANYDGTNDPIILTNAIALPGTLAATNYFGAGPCYINGTAINGVQEITVNNQVRLIQAGGESEEFDTFIGIETIETDITIKTFTMFNWETVLLRGLKLNGDATPTPGTGLVFYARKYLAGGSTGSGVSTRVPNGTAQHIKFNAPVGRIIPIDTTGNESSPITDTVKIESVALADTDIPMTITVNSAITAPSS